MRRVLSILLMACFALGPLTAALQADDDSRLPACCRRHGAHHCVMSAADTGAAMGAKADPALSAPLQCPYYPRSVARSTATGVALVADRQHAAQTIEARRATAASQPMTLSASARAHSVRGPPSIQA
jgi:hypothetical protein